MVVLTEALIKGKSKIIRLEEVKNLNLCGQGIDDVSVLRQAPNIEVLSMSVNRITSLRHFAFCGQLKQLYLRANQVDDLSELRYLMPLQHLSVLWLADNPCCTLPHYRPLVIVNMPQLECLDNVPISEEERESAHGMDLLQPVTAEQVLAEDLQAVMVDRDSHEQQPRQQQQQEQSVHSTSSMHSRISGASPHHIAPSPPAAAGKISSSHGNGGDAADSVQQQQQQQPTSCPSTSAVAALSGRSTPQMHEGLAATGMCCFSSCGCSPAPTPAPAPAFSVPSATSPPAAHLDPADPASQMLQQQPAMHALSEPGPLQQAMFTQQRAAWRPVPAGWVAPIGSMLSSGRPGGNSTNVLYAVMALLGELDSTSLSIVAREVELRLATWRA